MWSFTKGHSSADSVSSPHDADSSSATNTETGFAVVPRANDGHDAAFIARFQEKLAPLLDTIDRVRTLVQSEQDIKLPSIAVLGDQSTGKSSLLEGMMGIALPRGKGIVTRCPLVLQMRGAASENTSAKAWISYQPRNGPRVNEKELQSLDNVSDAIEAATEAICGSTKAVVDSPIQLRVEKWGVPNLTLIDLPGITRQAVGDQPENIYEIIRAMYDKYAADPHTIMLCVLPANTDFPTNECLKLARLHDPEGKRTLGVVTKADKAEKGLRDNLEAQSPQHVKLKLGFIAVRNRTPEELEANISRADVRRREAHFFMTGNDGFLPDLVGLSKRYWGMDTLEERLLSIQATSVLSMLPDIKKQLKEKIESTSGEMAEEASFIVTNETDAFTMVHRLLKLVQDRFHVACHGGHGMFADPTAVIALTPELTALYEGYAQQLRELIPHSFFFSAPCQDLIRDLDHKYKGMTLPNFLHQQVFEEAFRQVVYHKLKEPTDRLLEAVQQLVDSVLRRIIKAECMHFPKFQDLVTTRMSPYVEERASKAREVITIQVEAEEQPFTQDPAYMATMERLRDLRLSVSNNLSNYARQTDEHGVVMCKVPNVPFPVNLEFLQNLHVVDDYRLRHMEIQYSLAAYSHLLIRRMVDAVPLVLNKLLKQQVGTSVFNVLTAALSIEDDSTGKDDDVKAPSTPSANASSTASASGRQWLPLMMDDHKLARQQQLSGRLGKLRQAYDQLCKVHV